MARSGYFILIASLIFSSMSCYALKSSDGNTDLNIAKIQKAVGQTGQFNSSEKILVFTVPRDDLDIQMGGMQFSGSQGLSSHIVFKKVDNQAVVHSDFVLLPDQVNPVLSVALMNGLEVIGLNNPYLWDSPRVMIMDIQGEGDAVALATAIGKVLAKIKATQNGTGDFPIGNISAPETTLNGHRIDALLGVKGQFNNNVYQVQLGNQNKKASTELDKVIASHTWAAFSGSEDEAVVTGALVVQQSELQQTLMILRKAEFYILAIYRHSIEGDASLVSINYWGVGQLQALAKALHSAFVIAQNDSVLKTKVEGAFMNSVAVNAEKTTGIPITSALVQNNYCSYAVALRISSAARVEENKQQTKQVIQQLKTVAVAAPSRVKIKIPAVKVVDSKPVWPSAKNMMLRLSVVNNKYLLFAPLPKNVVAVIQTKIYKPKIQPVQNISMISAKRILASLSVVRNNQLRNGLLLQPKYMHYVTRERVTPLHSALLVASKVNDKRLAHRLSMLSAREMLSRLSIVKTRVF